ncbi:phosphatidylethanolamine methyltransferase [Thecamonas trahens ATCC 50062]|uniref:Phosphatidylethanolamine methyltransferase n=1 Tax=Thecamonas trahens ATCC 50062 TaxID=461836 RepID=A0A0L0DSY9_THETB|nr:phosphatidylethanolamine methyltransferase [Thecamonas trahens ATCC 50062]KNC55131.1 phosphatidylethanolamine methyltransferase [Thecamonas trahens ATCC 50062]|eukprot:XP_013753311.1 phosphatidylethanolamine methyltransferase [Thecamonas trahens ATCC 50062]
MLVAEAAPAVAGGGGAVEVVTGSSMLRQRKSGEEAGASTTAEGAREVVANTGVDETEWPEGVQLGITRKKEVFVVPDTRDSLERALDFGSWSASEYLRLALVVGVIINAIVAPGWMVIGAYVFWRLGYDLFLGILLRNQSQRRTLTRGWRDLRAKVEAGSATKVEAMFYKYARYWVVGTMSGSARYKEAGQPFDFDSVPIECQSWLVYRELADIVLNLDAAAHLVFCFRYFEAPVSVGFWAVIRYVLGLALIVFSFWAKKDALRVVKDFAWFWGDFWFLLYFPPKPKGSGSSSGSETGSEAGGDDSFELVFDGVFEMFPHPMYTVGYGFYYGLALMSHSYTVLYVSLLGHIAQLVFLALVETPHIDKTYGTGPEAPVRNPAGLEAYFAQDLIVLANLNPMRALDVATVLLVGYTLSLSLFGFSSAFYLCLALFWRLVHVTLTGGILSAQSASDWWIRQSAARGLDRVQAFNNWKHIYNLTLVLAHASFLVAALCVKWSAPTFTFGPLLFRIPTAAILLAINLWSARSSLDVLGEYGWFYADFFLPLPSREPEYTGIYRFLNNPDSVTGYLGYYGLAVLANEPAVVFLAMFSQISHWMFVILVEKPHMHKVYGEAERSVGGIEKHLKATLQREPIRKLIAHPFARKISESARQLSESARDMTASAKTSLGEFSASARVVTSLAKDLFDKTTDNAKKMTSHIIPEPLPDSDDDEPPVGGAS